MNAPADGLTRVVPDGNGCIKRWPRSILAHRVAITLEAMHAVQAFEEAFVRYRLPEMENLDQGSQGRLTTTRTDSVRRLVGAIFRVLSDFNAIPACFFCQLECAVSASHQGVDIALGCLARDHADADGEGNRLNAPCLLEILLLDTRAQFFSDHARRPVHIGTRQRRDELLAAPASEHRGTVRDRYADIGEHTQYLVADIVAVAVVDLLERVDVENEYGQRILCGERLIDEIEEFATIQQAGQRIGRGLLPELFHEPHTIGDVAGNCRELDHAVHVILEMAISTGMMVPSRCRP